VDKQQSEIEDSLSLSEVYQAIDIDHNVWTEVDVNGEQTMVIGKDFENGLKSIHKFVDQVRACAAPAFRIALTPSGRQVAHRTNISSMPTGAFITPEFQQAYEVSEQVRVFLEAEHELHLGQEHALSEPLRASWTQPGKLVADVANEFVQLLRKKTADKSFRRRVGVRRFGSVENFRRGKSLINALFRRRFRLNVLRIDFLYRNEHRPSLDQTKADMDRFLNNRRRKAIFKSVLGYIWHLEWGFHSGWHWHVMFFLNGSQTRHDTYVAQQFCDYWIHDITDGRGRCHNCNAAKNKYKRLGIGMISHRDVEKRNILNGDVLSYLTKIDEFVRPRVPKGTKTFGTSQMPEPHPGTGRRRRLAPIGGSCELDSGKFSI
jgi:hypothetical protein